MTIQSINTHSPYSINNYKSSRPSFKASVQRFAGKSLPDAKYLKESLKDFTISSLEAMRMRRTGTNHTISFESLFEAAKDSNSDALKLYDDCINFIREILVRADTPKPLKVQCGNYKGAEYTKTTWPNQTGYYEDQFIKKFFEENGSIAAESITPAKENMLMKFSSPANKEYLTVFGFRGEHGEIDTLRPRAIRIAKNIDEFFIQILP